MAKRPIKISEQRSQLKLGDFAVPLRIIVEAGRLNCRASIAKTAVIFRLPADMPRRERIKEEGHLVEWVKATYAEQPELFERFRPLEAAKNYTFSCQGTEYLIDVAFHQRRSHFIKLKEQNKIAISLNPTDERAQSGKIIPKLLAKLFGGIFLPKVAMRVHQLNDQYFQCTINEVKLSDSYSRWGSCSSKGNINLATRLLLAPDEVLDAVIIHELAHLVEANHSARFWAQVERALPDYRKYDEWLKVHGKELLFLPTPVG